MAKWVIRWVSPTGKEGGGTEGLSNPKVATFWVTELNTRPTLKGWSHWIEKVESDA